MRLPDPLAEIVVSVFGKARSGPYMAYSFEIAAILCAAMYMLCFVWGTARNKRIANRWYEEVFDDLAKNFSHIGNGQGAILRDGPADYIAFGSGRARCVKFVARLMLRERQDLLSVVSDFFNSGHDRVRFDVVLDPAASENFILGILHTRHVRSTVSTYEELGSLAKPLPTSHLPQDKFEVRAEHADVLHSFLVSDPRVHRFLSNPEVTSRLESLVVSDRVLIDEEDADDAPAPGPNTTSPRYRKVLSLTYKLRLPSGDLLKPVGDPAWAVHATMVQFVLFLIDHVSKMDIRSDVRSKMRRAREEVNVRVAAVVRAKVEQMSPEERKKQEARRKERRDRRQKSRSVRI